MKKSLINWYLNNGNPGLTWLKQNSGFFYDFTKQSGADTDIITSCPDVGDNSRDATPIGSPTIKVIQSGETEIKTYKDEVSKYFNTGDNGGGYLNQDFEILLMLSASARVSSGSWHLMGSTTSTNSAFILYFDSSGTLIVYYGNSVQNDRFDYRISGLQPSGAWGRHLIRVQCDFTNDTVKVWLDGVLQSGAYSFGNINDITASDYSTTYDLYVGSNNNVGTASSNNNEGYVEKIAATAIIPDAKLADVTNYFING